MCVGNVALLRKRLRKSTPHDQCRHVPQCHLGAPSGLTAITFGGNRRTGELPCSACMGHIEHGHGFSPVYVRSCLAMLPLSENRLGQRDHWNGFSPVCVRSWLVTWPFVLNCLRKSTPQDQCRCVPQCHLWGSPGFAATTFSGNCRSWDR